MRGNATNATPRRVLDGSWSLDCPHKEGCLPSDVHTGFISGTVCGLMRWLGSRKLLRDACNPLCSPPRHFFVGTLCRATLTFFCALSLELEYLQSSLLSPTHTACHSQKPPGTASQKRKSVHRDYQNPVRTLSEPVRTLSEPVRTLSERCEAKYGLS